ncbi:uncharacterized protein Dsimw501_GD27576 [Drosophila simulans]|nr:uncharacterized protein Dsimw501_GD17993 [Drosophila simulans]KMZ01357.1 uncharacterized protein Dsimw501_GD27576 [Drosophila simulans]
MTIKNLEEKLSLEFVKEINVNNTKTLELVKTTSHTADILMGCVLITGIVVITIRILIKVTKVTKFHINRTTDDKPSNDRNEWGDSILKADGLLLVPNGEALGYWLGDDNFQSQDMLDMSEINSLKNITSISNSRPQSSHSWGIFFTVLGTVLLDFDADACQSPARAYLLDVCLPEDQARGLSTFTIMAGLGGFFGYSMGGVNWDETEIGRRLGGHVKAVFSIITIIFIACVTFTLTSFAEIPLWVLANKDTKNCGGKMALSKSYGACDDDKTINCTDDNKQVINSYVYRSFYN